MDKCADETSKSTAILTAWSLLLLFLFSIVGVQWFQPGAFLRTFALNPMLLQISFIFTIVSLIGFAG